MFLPFQFRETVMRDGGEENREAFGPLLTQALRFCPAAAARLGSRWFQKWR